MKVCIAPLASRHDIEVHSPKASRALTAAKTLLPSTILATMSREPRFMYFSSEAKRRCTTCEVEIKSVSGACARPIPEHTRPRIRITSVILLAGYLPKNLDIK